MMKFYSLKFCSLLLLAIIGLGSFSNSAVSGYVEGYLSLDEYFARHPDQEAKTRAFERLVSGAPIRRDFQQPIPVRIIIVYPGYQVSDYWRRSVSSLRGRLKDLGIAFEAEVHFTSPGTQLQLQSMLIDKAISTAPDYMIFTLDALRHRGMVERVMAQGSTKIILQNITTPIEAFEPTQPFLYVGFDHGIGAKLLAERFKSEKPDGARFAILYGPNGYVSALRGGVFLNEMRNHPNSKLVASYYVNFDRVRAYNAAMEILSTEKELDFIYACSTDVALGVVDALKETGRLGDVLVNGWGGGDAELKAIEAGELDFTVMRMNDDNGIAMAEAIRLDLEGKADLVPTVYSGEFRVVDQNTSAADLQALKAHAFKYSK